MSSLQKYLKIIVCLIVIQFTIFPQELPVAIGSENTFAGGGGYDGTNFLISLVTVKDGNYEIQLQFIGPGPVLSGSRISTGISGSGTKIDFDGTNYLMTWTDPFPFFADGETNGVGNLYGRLINQSGQFVGNSFGIANSVNLKYGQGRGTLSFNGSYYLVTYVKGGYHQDILYGQLINTSGVLVGSPFQISSNYAREASIKFDGTNYLIVWCEGSGVDASIYGQLISDSGNLIGSNFLVDGSSNKSDNPTALGFDGNKYFVLFHDQATDDTTWNIYGRFVSKSGTVSSDRILLCDSTKFPSVPSIEFDGTEYLITWVEFKQHINTCGKFFDKNANPLGDDFIVFDTLGGKFALGGVAGYIPGQFIFGATRVDPEFKDCDVYVKGMDPLTDIDNMSNNNLPTEFILYQNYPNPFNPSTIIRYNLPFESNVKITLYDLLGKEVKVMVNRSEQAGSHSFNFLANELSSGIYFYKIDAISAKDSKLFTDTKKLLLLK